MRYFALMIVTACGCGAVNNVVDGDEPSAVGYSILTKMDQCDSPYVQSHISSITSVGYSGLSDKKEQWRIKVTLHGDETRVEADDVHCEKLLTSTDLKKIRQRAEKDIAAQVLKTLNK